MFWPRNLLTVLFAALLLAPAAVAQDWPMLAHDVQRSGATEAGVEGPLGRAWVRYFVDEGLMPSVQPVVVDDVVYVGTLHGQFYAIDAATGTDRWRVEVGGAVTHTACVADGLAFFGAADGVVYARNVADGSVAWTHQTGAPLWNAPLAWRGKVYLGGRDGIFYCFDAATGAVAWSAEVGAPITQSPALDPDAGRVVVTAEDRVCYAFDAESGALLWQSEQLPGTTARSFHPVIAPDGTVMTVSIPYYSFPDAHRPLDEALEALFGVETLEGEQVKTEGTFVRIPNWRHNQETNDRFDRHVREIFLAEGYFGRLVDELDRQIAQVPHARTLHLLDGGTGRLGPQAPILYTAFAKSQFTPPVVTPDGRVITKWYCFLPSTYHAYQNEVNVAYLDPATGQLSPVFDESRIDSGRDLGLIADESCQMSIAGTDLINIANHNGELVRHFDLSDPQRRTGGQFYTTHNHWWGVGVIHRILRGQTDQITPGQEDLTKGFGVMNPAELATGNHTAANMPVVCASGRLFYTSSGKLMALAPVEDAPEFPRDETIAAYGIEPLTDAELETLYSTWPINWDDVDVEPDSGQWGDHKMHTPPRIRYIPGTRQNPDTEAGAAADDVSDDVLDGYIWTAEAPGVATGDLAEPIRRRLVEQVEQWIAEPQWRPYRFMGGKHPTDYLEFFADPSEPIEALAWAYPHLPEDLQARVRAYVGDLLAADSSPLTLNELPGEGAAREPYIVPDLQGRTFRFARPRGFGRAYVLWLWGHRSGDWEMVRTHWPRVRPRGEGDLNPPKPNWWMGDDYDSGNNRCAALVACVRLARRFEEQAVVDVLLPVARQALRDRLRHELTYHRGAVAGRQLGLWRGFVRWQFMTPELGRFLAEQAPDVAPRLVGEYLDRIRPVWFLAWGPLSPSGLENSVQLPHNTLAGFQAEAFIADADPQRLAILCDIPHCPADPYYMQKLAVTLDAFAAEQ